MTKPHLINYLSRSDVDVVLARMPDELRQRVRDVFFTDSYAVRRLGSVTKRGRRDITLCSYLPPRVSLRRFMFAGCIASDFGAPSRGQWPPWAVRRYMLYDVLLHELGHLQLVGAHPGAWDGEFASEGLAQAFANEWRGRLYSEPFDHRDPVHNAPSEHELGMLTLWDRLGKTSRAHVTVMVLRGASPREVRHTVMAMAVRLSDCPVVPSRSGAGTGPDRR
jgi:hypothetical protein